jgi:hypothetical protein
MFASCAFMKEGKCGHFIPLDLDHEHASLLCCFKKKFMKTCWSMIPIGALDYEEMRIVNI